MAAADCCRVGGDILPEEKGGSTDEQEFARYRRVRMFQVEGRVRATVLRSLRRGPGWQERR